MIRLHFNFERVQIRTAILESKIPWSRTQNCVAKKITLELGNMEHNPNPGEVQLNIRMLYQNQCIKYCPAYITIKGSTRA